ncbi:MAG: hypothetical protein JO316_05460 [Abitibacteriaceae bacterium]|nr:hypothetical protein [Abditibacteriaceae bacterium]MBV9864774.1 hypothetical protein [Abditibacteriaceae bacterium]
MKFYCLWVPIVMALPMSAARADVSLEHSVTLRVTKFKQPLVKLKLFTNWTEQRNRVLVKYDLSGLPQTGAKIGDLIEQFDAMTNDASSTNAASDSAKKTAKGSPLFGGVGFVQRLDDDHLLAYSTQTHSYINEALKPLLEKLRFDPWKKLAPKLSKEAPPDLTPEQRQRLGAEVRAATSPLLRKVLHLYFRPLPNTRTFDGIEAHGYRLTMLFNVGGIRPKQQQWTRSNMEYWIAADLPGDETIRTFQKAAQDPARRALFKSSSMWVNEFWPVVWQTMPEELIQAVETLVPPAQSPRAGFGGTLVRLYYTTVLPPLQRASAGDVREEVVLTRRSTDTVAPTVFEAPTGYKQVQLDPYFKKYKDLLKGKMPGMSTFADFNESMGFSWQAWHEYTKALHSQMPFPMP